MFKKVKLFFKKQLSNKKTRRLYIFSFLAFVISLSLFTYIFRNSIQSEQGNTNLKIFNSSEGDKQDEISYPNPINGIMVDEEIYQRMMNIKPFFVTVNNNPDARPQAGLSKADMVTEFLVEGGATRYVATFWQNQPDEIGPVRSIRRYMIDYIAGYDSPAILHEGGAGFNDTDPVYVRETDALTDLFEFSMKSINTPSSRYRDQERLSRYDYEHTLMTSYELIEKDFNALAEQRNWERETNIDEFEFKEDEQVPFPEYTKINLDFLRNSSYSSSFEYNDETNSYDRFISEKEDIDDLDGTQISPKNVVVEWHSYRLAQDGYGRIIIDMLGEGDAMIFQDGKSIEAEWVKENREDRTKYYNKEGELIKFNRGQIWKSILIEQGGVKLSNLDIEEAVNLEQTSTDEDTNEI